MSCAIIFVCHNNHSISKVINHGEYILFVGNNEIDDCYKNNPKITIVRNLPNNIENEKKLLTFTAWYAIIKNNLFSEYTHMCILEWDTTYNQDFKSRLQDECTRSKAISFLQHSISELYLDININVFNNFLLLKGLDTSIINSVQLWGSSSNQCLDKNILEQFVNWYYPSYLFIKTHHYHKLSWYHERLYMIFLKSINQPYSMVYGLTHHYSGSHHGHIN